MVLLNSFIPWINQKAEIVMKHHQLSKQDKIGTIYSKHCYAMFESLENLKVQNA